MSGLCNKGPWELEWLIDSAVSTDLFDSELKLKCFVN